LWENNLVKEASNTFQLFALCTAITDTELQLRIREIIIIIIIIIII